MSADCIRAICFNITTVNSTAETGYAGKIRLMLVLRQVNTGHSTFHWDANIKRFGVGKQPQIPVFFALIRALTSTLSPAMLVSNSWNLLLNRSFIKKKKKRIKIHKSAASIQIENKHSWEAFRSFCLAIPGSCSHHLSAAALTLDSFFAISSSTDLVFQTYQSPTTEELLCLRNYNCTECTTGSAT